MEINPDDSAARFQNGCALRELERYEEARTAFTRALAIDPSHLSAYESGVKMEGGTAEKFPRIQILTIAQLLAGTKLVFPRHDIGTFKQAERESRVVAEQGGLF